MGRETSRGSSEALHACDHTQLAQLNRVCGQRKVPRVAASMGGDGNGECVAELAPSDALVLLDTA